MPKKGSYREIPFGLKVGELVVLDFSHIDKVARWWTVCSCGNIQTKKSSELLTPTRLIGCGNCLWYKKQPTEYSAWCSMNSRCLDKSHSDYKNYGGRGITVCTRWKSFVNFFIDMGPKENSSLSLDRIDNEGNYEPANCRWATTTQQAYNQRRRLHRYTQ